MAGTDLALPDLGRRGHQDDPLYKIRGLLRQGPKAAHGLRDFGHYRLWIMLAPTDAGPTEPDLPMPTPETRVTCAGTSSMAAAVGPGLSRCIAADHC
jgi:hypothetical protein